MKIYFFSDIKFNFEDSNTLDKSFKHKINKINNILKNSINCNIIISCGGFLNEYSNKNIYISKKLIKFLEILKLNILGSDENLLEITNYESNFINNNINIKTNLFIFDKENNRLIDFLHQTLLLNYYPIFSNIEFMIDKKLIIKLKNSFFVFYSIYFNDINQENIDILINDTLKYFNIDKSKKNEIYFGLIIIGESLYSHKFIEIIINSKFDFIIISTLIFDSNNCYSQICDELNLFSFNNIKILNMKNNIKKLVSRDCILSIKNSIIKFKYTNEKIKPDILIIDIKIDLPITNQILISIIKNKLIYKKQQNLFLVLNIENETNLQISINCQIIEFLKFHFINSNEIIESLNKKINNHRLEIKNLNMD